MAISLKESRSVTEMAKLLYNFLPGSGSSAWKGHVNFRTVAQEVGVGNFWQRGSKEQAIAQLLELTLEHRRDRFEPLILAIVRSGLKYREKNNDPIRAKEIITINGLILEIGFKFPSLWDPEFLKSLENAGPERASAQVERELLSERIRASSKNELANRLDEVKSAFYQLQRQSDRQQAGLDFEGVLKELFEIFGLAPRSSFRIQGEQIDGSFELDGQVYLLEAKWLSQPVSQQPLLAFRGKVEGKSAWTRGVFIAMNGYSEQAVAAITQGKQPNFFLMDGYDLTMVLEGQWRLDELLRATSRRLAEEGRVFISVKDMTPTR